MDMSEDAGPAESSATSGTTDKQQTGEKDARSQSTEKNALTPTSPVTSSPPHELLITSDPIPEQPATTSVIASTSAVTADSTSAPAAIADRAPGSSVTSTTEKTAGDEKKDSSTPDTKKQVADQKQDAEMTDMTEKEKRTGAGPSGSGSRRNWRNNRRKRKRKVFNRRSRPYQKPSRDWDGEQPDRSDLSLNLDQEQERRANFVRISMQKYGKPFAPYNTTQFLMEDHNVREPEFEEIAKYLRSYQQHESKDRDKEMSERVSGIDATARDADGSFSTRDGSDSEDFYSSPDDEHDFQQRQFSEVYEYVHAERLSAMSKSQLVQEYLLLEQKVEYLESKLKESQAQLTAAKSGTGTNAPAQVEAERVHSEDLRFATVAAATTSSSSGNSSDQM